MQGNYQPNAKSMITSAKKTADKAGSLLNLGGKIRNFQQSTSGGQRIGSLIDILNIFK